MKNGRFLRNLEVSDYSSGALSTFITTILMWRNNKRPRRQKIRARNIVGMDRAGGQSDNDRIDYNNGDICETGAAEDDCKLRLIGPYIVVGGILVVVVSTLSITGLVGVTIILMGMRVTYTRVRQSGLLPYLSPSTRRLLAQTSLMDVIANCMRRTPSEGGGLLGYIPPYVMMSLLGTSEEEMRCTAFRLPSPVRRALFRPGVLHALPPQLQAVILPQSASLPPSLQCSSPVQQGQERQEIVNTIGTVEEESPVSHQQGQQQHTCSTIALAEPAVTPAELVREIIRKRVKSAVFSMLKQHALPCALITGFGFTFASRAQKRALMAGLTAATLFVSSIKSGFRIDLTQLLVRTRRLLFSTRSAQIFRFCLLLLVLKVAGSIYWKGRQRPRLASKLPIWGKSAIL